MKKPPRSNGIEQGAEDLRASDKASKQKPAGTRGAEARSGEKRRGDRHAVLERNLERYPWSRLSDERGDQAQLQLLLDRAGADGAAWTVTPPQNDRLPGPFDADIYIALATVYNSQIPLEERKNRRSVTTSLGELAEIMGRERGGTTYKAIRASLLRLRRTEVRAVRTFRERDETGDRDVVAEERIFSLIGEFAYRYRRDGDRAKTGVIVELPQVIADSIARKHYRLINVGLYFGLETPTARRLFRYLDIKRWRGREARTTMSLTLAELAAELPIDREAPSHIKRTLQPAHEQLIASRYLESAAFVERVVPGKKRPLWVVEYAFGERADQADDLAVVPLRGLPDGNRVLSAEESTRTVGSSGDSTYLRDIVAEIVGTLRDDHSLGWYVKVAKALPEEALRNILGGARQMIREGKGLDLARKTFTATAKKRAQSMGVEL